MSLSKVFIMNCLVIVVFCVLGKIDLFKSASQKHFIDLDTRTQCPTLKFPERTLRA